MKRLMVIVFTAVLFFSGISWSYPTDGLVSYWGFNDPSNPTHDETGNHDGTNYGADYVSNGVYGGAYQFSGTDYIDVGEGNGDFDLGSDDKMTISMWVRPENPVSPPDFWQFELMNKIEQNIYDGWHFNLGVNHGSPELNLGFAKHYINDDNSPVISWQQDPTGLGFDQWYNLAAVINGTLSKLYINGVEVGAYSRKDDMDQGDADNERHLFIGSNPNPIYRTYAAIDEVFIYGRALGDSEIQKLWGDYDGGTSGGGGSDPVPEPATMLLLGSGLIGLAGFRRKFKSV